jgi:hypothetical protein
MDHLFQGIAASRRDMDNSTELLVTVRGAMISQPIESFSFRPWMGRSTARCLAFNLVASGENNFSLIEPIFVHVKYRDRTEKLAFLFDNLSL